MTDPGTADLSITAIVVPASVDAPDAAAFRAISTLGNAVCRHDAGHDHFDEDPSEILPAWQDDTDVRHLGFTADRGGEIVGVLTIAAGTEAESTNLEFDLMVEPERWGEGIEEALLARLEIEARLLGRRVLQTWTLHRPDTTASRLEAATGFGSIPADDRQTALMLDSGFTLEQVERNSVFELSGSFEVVDRMLANASAFAGDDYRLVTWTTPTPDRYKEGYGYAVSRMSTDVPAGALEFAEETWDAARVERRDAQLGAGGQTMSVAAIEHVPTGVIAAYTEIAIGADHGATSHQWGTLVLKEHRGRRLGTIVKCANLRRWREIMPRSPRVSTFNAEENRPMLDVNEAVGFVPASYAGAWKKTLS